jgi:hypothetical protein
MAADQVQGMLDIARLVDVRCFLDFARVPIRKQKQRERCEQQ